MKVLIIGNLQNESVINIFRMKNIEYKTKLLSSTIDNWRMILDLIKSREYFVILKLSETDMMRACIPENKQVFYDIIDSIIGIEHMVLIYEENLNCKYSYVNEENLSKLNLTNREKVIDSLDTISNYIIENDMNYYTYKFTLDLEYMVREYIDMKVDGLLMKFYIPKEKFISQELTKMVDMFETYLNSIYDIYFSIQRKNTREGYIIEFYSDEQNFELVESEWSDFPNKIEEFSKSIGQSLELINRANLSENRKEELAKSLNIEARRIIVDIKHDMNKKVLELNYLVENKILNYEVEDSTEIDSSNIITDFRDSNFKTSKNAIIQNPTYINKMEGNIINNEYDQKLIDLIRDVSNPKKKRELISILNEFNDKNIEKNKKLTLGNKLKKFLRKNASRLEKEFIQVLFNYIESKFI